MSCTRFDTAALVAAVASIGLGLLPLPAQAFPDGPVTMIVPFSTGGGNDTVARLMSQYVEEHLGVRMVVENQPGAGGQVGWTRLAAETADGHTIGMISSPSIFLIEFMRENVAFSLDDFQAIAHIQSDPIVLAVNARGALESYDDLVAAMEANPGGVNVGGDGPHSNVHLQVAAFEEALDLDANFIAYSGSGPAAEALLGTEVDAAFLTASAALPFIDAGRIRPLAVISADRHPALPDLPTLAEISGRDVPAVGTAIRGVIAPAGVPAERVARLEAAFEQMLNDEEFIARANDMGLVVRFVGADEFTDLLSELRERSRSYVDLVK